MKIELISVSRRLPWPVWALCLVLGWMALGFVAILLGSYTGQSVQLCLFKRLSGLACPTCGLVRGTFAFLGGEIGTGWLYNPLLFSIIALFFWDSVSRLVFAKGLRIDISPRERAVVWIAAVAVGLANWAYVVLYVG